MEDNYKNNVQKSQFETPKRFSFKNSNKTQDNEINITQNRYEVLNDSYGTILQMCNSSDSNDIIGWNNDNGKSSNNVTTSVSSRQVNLGKAYKSIKARQKREIKRIVVLQ